jgi:minimal CRISPR polymerase domain
MYYAVDGDDVGRSLERFLLENDPGAATVFSRRLTQDVEAIRRYFEERGASIIFCAGDGLLAQSTTPIEAEPVIRGASGATFSVGVGDTTANALLALKKAKGLGKARLESQFEK